MNRGQEIFNKFGGFLAMVMIFAISCGEMADERYDEWARYTDSDDSYVVLIPPKWLAEGHSIPGMRGTQFAPTDSYTDEMAGFVYYSIFVQDLEDTEKTFQEISEEAVKKIAEDSWAETEWTSKEGRMAGYDALIFDLNGLPYYTEFKLKAEITTFRQGNKLFVLFASATQNSFPALQERYTLITQSLKFIQ